MEKTNSLLFIHFRYQNGPSWLSNHRKVFHTSHLFSHLQHLRGLGKPDTLIMQISLTALVIHSGHAALPVPPILFTLQLPTFQSGKTLARHDALGLWVLDRIRSFRPFRRLLFFARHDVLSKVSMIDKLVIKKMSHWRQRRQRYSSLTFLSVFDSVGV